MLKGIRVLELGQVLAGTFGGTLLADLGAEVIKVESPTGDIGRNPSIAHYKGYSGLFLTLNVNKKSISIDLKSEEGKKIFYDLVKVSDVVIDNFRPGALERLGIDYDKLKEVNKEIICCSVVGFSADSSYWDRPSYDIIHQAITGHMSLTGEPDRPPVRIGTPIADLAAAMFGIIGILSAIINRKTTKEGKKIEVAMYNSMVCLLSYIGSMYLNAGEIPKPPGSAHEYMVPYQAFPVKGGDYIVIAPRENPIWVKLCQVMGRPELATNPKFETNKARLENRSELVQILTEEFEKQPSSYWVKLLSENGIPVAPVNKLDKVFEEPYSIEQEVCTSYEHPKLGEFKLPASPIRIKNREKTPNRHAPDLGEHTEIIASKILGYSDNVIKDFIDRKILVKN